MQRQQGNTTYHIVFLMTDSADHVTGKTGLTPTVSLSKNGGAYAAAEGAVSEIANGLYKLAADADDFDTLGALAVHAEAVGADPADILLDVVSYDPYTDVAAILTDTGTTIPASIDALPTAAEIWANSTRTLTQSATSITAAVSGSSITDIRGNDWEIEITGLTLDSNKQQFFIKRSSGYPDAEAILGIDSDTGTLYVNGVAATEAQELLASLSYTGTTLTVTVSASITAQIPAGTWVYGIQSVTAAGVVAESYGGTFIVTADVVRAVA